MQNDEVSKPRREKIITLNKKAFHEYLISNKYEAGIVLTGTEVKSLRENKASIQESYGKLKSNEVWLVNSNIPEYKFGNLNNHEPKRDRKLLLNKSEIRKIVGKLKEQGLTLIPLKLYFLNGKAKVEIGIAKGKKLYDKRESIKQADVKRKLRKVKANY